MDDKYVQLTLFAFITFALSTRIIYNLLVYNDNLTLVPSQTLVVNVFAKRKNTPEDLLNGISSHWFK